MTLQDVQVDDRTYDQLLTVLQKQLPADYTDHNPSDALISLLELFCWLGEMSLYRMNRIPKEHEQKFLDLLIDPPEPVTVPVTFTIGYGPGGAHAVLIPAGTRVATDFASGRRSVFETTSAVALPVPTSPASTGTGSVTAREFLEVEGEWLGTADGTPEQTFQLRPVHSEHGLDFDAPAPVLLDHVHRSAEYDPNPQVFTFRGVLNGISGPLSPTRGVLAIHFDGAPVEAHFFLTYAPPNLTLTRGDGAAETVGVAAGPVAPGTTETVSFPAFEARLVLGELFDKPTAFGLGADGVAIPDGAGDIDAATLAVLSTAGSVAGITSTEIAVSGFDDLAHLSLALVSGIRASLDLRGSFDGSVIGAREVVLEDQEGNSLSLSLDVLTLFDGNETAATITLGRLENLLVHGAQRWTTHHSLLTEQSAVDPLDPSRPRHVQLDPLARTIRFGDGKSFGALPPPGAKVVCARYQLLRGPPDLVEQGEVRHLVSAVDGLAAGDALKVTNPDDAFGGRGFFNREERTAKGLQGFTRPYRLVTSDDFERVLLEDFNEYQKLAGRAERIARAAAVMNRKPPLDLAGAAPGNVTVLVVRALSPAEQALWDELGVPLATKRALLGMTTLDPLDPLRRKIASFLDERRLITTRVHVVAPELLGIQLELSFVIDAHRNAAEMAQLVGDAVERHLSLLEGGLEGSGRPLGRSIYRSELYRLVEEQDGVDHVQSLSLAPADADGDVAVGPHQLPVLTSLGVFPLRP